MRPPNIGTEYGRSQMPSHFRGSLLVGPRFLVDLPKLMLENQWFAAMDGAH
jgi:hypothetical protein